MSLKNVSNKPRISQYQGNWSIAHRLTWLYTASTLAMLMLAAAYLYWSLVKDVNGDDNDFLANKIQECRRLLRGGMPDTPLLAHEVETEAAASQFITYYVRLVDSQGQPVIETPEMANILPVNLFPAAADAATVPSRGTIWKSGAGRSYLLMSAWADAAGGSRRLIQVAIDVSGDEELIASYRIKLAAVVLSGLLFSCVVGVFVARRGLRTLAEITQATERITASQLHERIAGENWPKELASLARGFDRMLDRLEDSFKRLSQFSADLAHELRTPINNLRGEAGVALSQHRSPEEYRRTLESSLEEFERLTRLIDNLLFLARADSPEIGISRQNCDALRAVEAVCEFYEALAEERGVEIQCGGQGTVNADPILLRQAVSNLLSNALNNTPSGGKIYVQVEEPRGRGLEVRVSDTGCWIFPEHMPHIFDRLYRSDPARSKHPDGAGLGLAIVKSIMTMHGGSVDVQSEAGKGARFTLFFPITTAGAT